MNKIGISVRSWIKAAAFGLAVCVGQAALALTETVKGVEYYYELETCDDGTTIAVIASRGSDPAVPRTVTGALTIPSELGGHPVGRIGNSAFCDCSSLEAIVVPDSVSSIGSYAFSYCGNLKSISFGEGVTSIPSSCCSECTALTTVSLPQGLTEIQYRAFYDCTALASIDLPATLERLCDSAFASCTALTSVALPGSLVEIDSGAFGWCSSLKTISVAADHPAYTIVNGCVVSKDGETLVLCPGGFSGVFTLPAGIVELGSGAFMGCTGLTSVVFNSDLEIIGGNAFNGCAALGEMTIPEGVVEVGGYAFTQCTSLTNVVIPASLDYVGWYVFGDWSSGMSVKVTFADGVEEIPADFFEDTYCLCEIDFPDSLRSIGREAFYNCSDLQMVNTAWLDSVTLSCRAALRAWVVKAALETTKAAVAW